jgi:hypothetical protein
MPQRQMDWLKRKVRDKGEAVSFKDLKRIRDDKFNPPPPPANSFAEADRIWEECKARAITQGKCPRCLGEGIKRNGDFCQCAEGEAERAAETKREEERRKQRSVLRPPSIGGFGVNLEVLHPTEVGKQRKRAAKPTGKDWADTTPTLERLQCLLQKNASQWSVVDKVSRFDQKKHA